MINRTQPKLNASSQPKEDQMSAVTTTWTHVIT